MKAFAGIHIDDIAAQQDNKILTTILATRLNKMLDCCINPDQVGFTKGRQPRDCTCRLSNIKNCNILKPVLCNISVMPKGHFI